VRPSDCENVAKRSKKGKMFKHCQNKSTQGPCSGANENFGLGFERMKLNEKNLNFVLR